MSSTLADPAWENTTVIGFEDIAGLKQAGDGPVLVYGSARLAHALIENDLVDEYRAMINPVVIADGLRMFPSVEQMKLLRLTEAIPYALNASQPSSPPRPPGAPMTPTAGAVEGIRLQPDRFTPYAYSPDPNCRSRSKP